MRILKILFLYIAFGLQEECCAFGEVQEQVGFEQSMGKRGLKTMTWLEMSLRNQRNSQNFDNYLCKYSDIHISKKMSARARRAPNSKTRKNLALRASARWRALSSKIDGARALHGPRARQGAQSHL